MYKELLYWEKKFKKRQGRLRIPGSRWCGQAAPSPSRAWLPAGAAGRAGQGAAHTLAWRADRRHREGKGGRRGQGRARGPESWPPVPLQQAAPRPPRRAGLVTAPSAQEDSGMEPRPDPGHSSSRSGQGEDSTVKPEASGRPSPCPSRLPPLLPPKHALSRGGRAACPDKPRPSASS